MKSLNIDIKKWEGLSQCSKYITKNSVKRIENVVKSQTFVQPLKNKNFNNSSDQCKRSPSQT